MTATLIISDIHANPWALDAVLSHAHKRFSLGEIWFLGDLFGYGPAPYQVWNKLCKKPVLPTTLLAGNHDWGIIGRIEGPKVIPDENGFFKGSVHIGHYREAAYKVIIRHQEVLRSKKNLLEQMVGYPVMSSPRKGVYLVHGEMIDTPYKSVTQYTKHPLLSPTEIAKKFKEAKQSAEQSQDVHLPEEHTKGLPQIFCSGHTHLQCLWRWDAETLQWQSHAIDQPYSIKNLEEVPILFNPGSVGFPRDPSGCPAYAVLDWDNEILSFHHVWYDTAPLREAMSTEPYISLISDPRFFIEPNCQENL